jgi:hypothetical protein
VGVARLVGLEKHRLGPDHRDSTHRRLSRRRAGGQLRQTTTPRPSALLVLSVAAVVLPRGALMNTASPTEPKRSLCHRKSLFPGRWAPGSTAPGPSAPTRRAAYCADGGTCHVR